MTLFEELYNYFYTTYFSPDLSAIQNFDTYDTERFLPYLVVGLCAGVFFAICSTYYVNHYLGKVVRKLYSRRVFSPEAALTLDELELNQFLIRRSLFKETIVSKYVKATEEMKSIRDAKNAKAFVRRRIKVTAQLIKVNTILSLQCSAL